MKIIKGDFLGANKQANKLGNEVEYSTILLDLIKPYLPVTPDLDDLEDMLGLGIIGWNMAVSKALGFPGFNELFDKTMSSASIKKKEKDIVKKIMYAKQQHYSEHMELIENYELSEDEEGITILSIFSKPFVEFIAGDGIDEENEEWQYEEGFINRNAILVKPKPAFWLWAKENTHEFIVPDPPEEHTIYLIKEQDSLKNATAWLKQNFDKIFINELEGWIEDENYWPKKRNLKMFKDFFELEYHSLVMDLEKEPVIKD